MVVFYSLIGGLLYIQMVSRTTEFIRPVATHEMKFQRRTSNIAEMRYRFKNRKV